MSLVTVFFCMLISGFSMTVTAGHTEVGEPAVQTFVRSSDKRPVIIFVGDSRAMMCTYPKGNPGSRSNFCFCWVNGGNDTVIHKSGKLTPHVERMIRQYTGRCVVALNLGVNGNSNPKSNAARIIRIYRRWMKQYPDVKFFVVSINPSLAKTGPYANSKIIALNRLLRSEFEPEGIYIDTYTSLMKSGLVTGKARGMRDQYHYEWSAGKKILMSVRKHVTAFLNQAS